MSHENTQYEQASLGQGTGRLDHFLVLDSDSETEMDGQAWIFWVEETDRPVQKT